VLRADGWAVPKAALKENQMVGSTADQRDDQKAAPRAVLRAVHSDFH